MSTDGSAQEFRSWTVQQAAQWAGSLFDEQQDREEVLKFLQSWVEQRIDGGALAMFSRLQPKDADEGLKQASTMHCTACAALQCSGSVERHRERVWQARLLSKACCVQVGVSKWGYRLKIMGAVRDLANAAGAHGSSAAPPSASAPAVGLGGCGRAGGQCEGSLPTKANSSGGSLAVEGYG